MRIIRHVFDPGPQETPKTAKLVTIGMYGVSQGQWSRMTFGRTRYNVKGQMLSCSDLNHVWCLHSTQWQQAPCGWKHDFFEKSVGGCTSYDVIFVAWFDPVNFFHEKLRKERPVSFAKFQRDPPSGSPAIQGKLMGVASTPPARARVESKLADTELLSRGVLRCWWMGERVAEACSG